MNKRIIIEDNLNRIQKIHMLIVLIFGIGFYLLSKKNDYQYKDIVEFITTILIIIFVVGLIAFIFSKKGLLVDQNELFKAYFVYNNLIFKRKIDLNNKPIVSILKLKKSQNYPSISLIYPSSSHSFNRFDVYLLNKSHTIKDELIDLKEQDNAKRIVDFLIKNIDLKFEIYSPNFN